MEQESLSEAELDDRFKKGNPVDRSVLDVDEVNAALIAVRGSIESGIRPRVLPPARNVLHRQRWVMLGTTVIVVVACLVGVEGLSGGSGSSQSPLSVSVAAAAQLQRVAHAAANQPVPTTNQWEYMEWRTERLASTTIKGSLIQYTQVLTQQTWEGAGSNTRWISTDDGFSFATAQDKKIYVANQTAFDKKVGYKPTGVHDETLRNSSATQPSWETHVPSGPRALLKEIWAPEQAQQKHLPRSDRVRRPVYLWGALTNILRTSVSPRLRATAYRALRYVSGTKLLGARKDELGRSGVAISFGERGSDSKETIIASSLTGDLLELEYIPTVATGGLPAGTVQQRWIFVKRAIVARPTELPNGRTEAYHPASQSR